MVACKFGFDRKIRNQHALIEKVARRLCELDGKEPEYTWRWFSWTKRHHVENWKHYRAQAEIAINITLQEAAHVVNEEYVSLPTEHRLLLTAAASRVLDLGRSE